MEEEEIQLAKERVDGLLLKKAKCSAMTSTMCPTTATVALPTTATATTSSKHSHQQQQQQQTSDPDDSLLCQFKGALKGNQNDSREMLRQPAGSNSDEMFSFMSKLESEGELHLFNGARKLEKSCSVNAHSNGMWSAFGGKAKSPADLRAEFRDSLIRATKISRQKRDAMVVDLRNEQLRKQRTYSEKIFGGGGNKRDKKSTHYNYNDMEGNNDEYSADAAVGDVSFDECAEADSIFPPSSHKSMLISIANSFMKTQNRPMIPTESVIEVDEESPPQKEKHKKQQNEKKNLKHDEEEASMVYYDEDTLQNSQARETLKHEIKFNKQFFIDCNDQRSGRITMGRAPQGMLIAGGGGGSNGGGSGGNSSGGAVDQEASAGNERVSDNNQQNVLQQLHFSTERLSLEKSDLNSNSNGNSNTHGNNQLLECSQQTEQHNSQQQFRVSNEIDQVRSTYEAQSRSGAISLSTFIQTKQNTLMKGWVSKRSSNVLMGWQERWLVLKFKRLQYFKKTASSHYQGCIDFSLLDCSFQKIHSKTGELIEIRIVILNSSKVFRFRKSKNPMSPSLSLWADAISNAIEMSLKSKSAVKPKHLTLEKTFWKNDRISLEEFQSLADTGDIILFKGKTFGDKMFRNLIRCEYNHIGLILRTSTDDNNLLILEATGEEGVGLLSWKTFLRRNWQDLYHKISLRKLQAERTDDMLTKMESFVRYSLGKQYNVSISKLFGGSSQAEADLVEDPERTYFCSELIASIYKVCGFLPLDRCSAKYWPSSFEGSRNLQLMNGASLSEEFIIDFAI